MTPHIPIRPWIVDMNAVTPLGLDWRATAAATRAQLTVFSESIFIDKAGDPIVTARIPGLDESLTGSARLTEIALGALLPLIEKLFEKGFSVADIPMFLGLPLHRPGLTHQLGSHFLHELANALNMSQPSSQWEAICQGHASTLLGVEKAAQLLSREEAHICIVGGVDSYWHIDILEWLDREKRLHSGSNPDGFVPGEAAAFVVLTSPDVVRRLGLSPLAQVLSVASDQEENPLLSTGICIGKGLTSVLRTACTTGGQQQPVADWVVADLNGESFRSTEWSYAWLRTGAFYRDPMVIWHPADCYGDVGAASGAVLMTISTAALVEGYSKGSTAVVWTSSDGPLRGALLLSKTEKE